MKRQFLFFISLMLATSMLAQLKSPEVIYTKPEGTLQTFERHGKAVKENNDGTAIDVIEQEGIIDIVFAENGEVYFHDILSTYFLGDSWAKGYLSDDGTTITLPMFQYIDYTRTFDMAYQLKVMVFDDEKQTYVPDSTATELTFTVSADGSISLDGTSQERILGRVTRTFGNPQGAAIGQDFMYMDNTWPGDGDFETVFTPTTIEIQQPDRSVPMNVYYLTTAAYMLDYKSLSLTTVLGFDGDVAWLQGFNEFLPQAWIRGERTETSVTFPSGQYIGSYSGAPFYMIGATLDADGNAIIKDLELTLNDRGEYTTTDIFFISTSPYSIQYVTYYMGLTLSRKADKVVQAPEDLSTETYTMNYQVLNTATNRLVKQQMKLQAGLHDEVFYVKGIWTGLPDAWVSGTVDGETVTFSLPQYLGKYTDEESGNEYAMYLTAFDEQTGELLPSMTFSYDSQAFSLSEASSSLSIGICKTAYLSVQDYYHPTLTNDRTLSIAMRSRLDSAAASAFYDLQGRRVSRSSRNVVIQDGRKYILR